MFLIFFPTFFKNCLIILITSKQNLFQTYNCYPPFLIYLLVSFLGAGNDKLNAEKLQDKGCEVTL